VVSSCNFPFVPGKYHIVEVTTKFNKELFDMNNRGVIVVQMENDEIPNSYFTIVGGNLEVPVSSYRDKPNVLMLPIGKYTLKDFYLRSVVSGGNYTITREMNLRNVIKPVEIEVEAGKVTYIGKIMVGITMISPRSSQRRVKVSIQDKLSEKDIRKIEKETGLNIESNLIKMENSL
jgi:hypothetical protein